jgi:hypothetical protein
VKGMAVGKNSYMKEQAGSSHLIEFPENHPLSFAVCHDLQNALTVMYDATNGMMLHHRNVKM